LSVAFNGTERRAGGRGGENLFAGPRQRGPEGLREQIAIPRWSGKGERYFTAHFIADVALSIALLALSLSYFTRHEAAHGA